MAVGLLGLVGLQLYWIGSAIQLQKEQFAYKVTDALQDVVRTLERQEIVYLTRQRVQAREHQNRLMAIAKPAPKPVAKTRQKPLPATEQLAAADAARNQPSAGIDRPSTVAGLPTGGAVVVQSDVLHPTVRPLSAEQMMVVEEFFRQQDELMAVGDWQTQLLQQQQFDRWVEHIMADELNRINAEVAEKNKQQERLKKAAKRRMQQLTEKRSQQIAQAEKPASLTQVRANEQSAMIKDVLKGLLMSDRPIEDRVNRLALDTLLRQAMTERGISIPFAYGVRTSQKPTFLFSSLNTQPRQFAEDGYKAALFPNNLLDTGNYLYVYFPTQQAFILNRLWFTFAASAVLILVILACFYIAISTIVRQKKLADIKNDFINNMTHEFKTPISTISLAVEMAENVGPVSGSDDAQSRLSRYMGIIRDETRRLGSHVEKVLQMALLDRGEIKLKLSSVNVHDVIEKVLNNIGLQIEQREGEVELEFEAEHEIIDADEVHITNVLYNLIDNAIKYSPERPNITIRTRNTPVGSPVAGISIIVADQGLGMTKDQLSRIFEKFYRVPTGNRHDVKGFGLGLSYVKKMIDEHHGHINVESQPGRGSSFEIVLPYKIVND